MSRNNCSDLLKFIIRQKIHLAKKKRNRRLSPHRLTLKKLNKQKNYYANIITKLEAEIEQWESSGEHNLYDKKRKLENFTYLSFNGDRMGKVFTKDGHIYRGIYKESCADFEKLWESGILQVLAKHRYVPETIVTEYCTDEYPIILEHSLVTMSASKVWNYEMVKDACISMSIIQTICNRYGFKIHDGHLNNITFHNGCPVFTDIGSFVIDDGVHISFQSGIVFAGLYRLLFWQLDNSILKRIQVYDENSNGIWIKPMYYNDYTLEYNLLKKKFMRYHIFHSSILYNLILRKLFYYYDIRPEYIWAIFSDNELTEKCKYNLDIKNIIDVLKNRNYKFGSFLDVGGNEGFLAEQLYREIAVRGIALDYEDKESEITYLRYKKKDVPINTYLVNYIYGMDDSTRKNIISDIVTAIDITNNIAVYQSWKIDSLFNALSKITNEYVCVTIHASERFDIENENCENIFVRFFDIVEKNIFITDKGNKAILLLGRKRLEEVNNEDKSVI